MDEPKKESGGKSTDLLARKLVQVPKHELAKQIRLAKDRKRKKKK